MAGFIQKAFPALPRLFNAVLPRVKPYTPMGVAGTPVYAGYVITPERNPKVIGQQRYRTYADILANISIVAAGVRYFLNIVARPSWSADAADDSDEAKQLAEFVENVLFEDLHTPWSRVVRRSGSYRFYGFAVNEWTAIKRDDGYIGFEDIESRPQWTIWRWEVDDQGYVTGMWQRDPLTGRELGLPRGKVMYLCDDTLTDSPEGMGLLRHVVEPATRLEEYLKQESYGFMRDLRGVPIGRAPLDELEAQVAAGTLARADRDKAVEDLLDFVQLERKAKNTALLLNSQPYINRTDTGEVMASQYKWGVELQAGAAPGLADMGKAIERLNMEMARILGVEQLMLGSGSGSYALAKDKSVNLYTLANSVLRDIRLQAQHDLLWPLWSLNGFDEKLMPELKAEDVSPRDVEQVSKVLSQMAQAGFVGQPDDEIQNYVRDLLGAPHIDLAKLANMGDLSGITTEDEDTETDPGSGIEQDAGSGGGDSSATSSSGSGGGFGKRLKKREMITKKEAGYVGRSKKNAHCGICSMFKPQNGCTLVKGFISADGWCKNFDAKDKK